MQLGMIGLGRMGDDMVRHLLRTGHACVVHDQQPVAMNPLVEEGAIAGATLQQLVSALSRPRLLWLMVPAAVHNGIEYALMAAYAEGLNILRNANVGQSDLERERDAETTPLRDPELYRFEMNLPEITEVWRRGSVIGSWLLDLTAQALQKDPELARYAGRVSDSGEGRWTLQSAIDEGVPAPVLSAALFERFASCGAADFSNRVLSAMRDEFGGHAEKSAT